MLGACLLLLVCAWLLLRLRTASLARPDPARALQGLPVVRACDVAEQRLRFPDQPWFVVDAPIVPDAHAWRLWGCEAVRVLLSPDGVFGAYGECDGDAEMDEESRRIIFQSAHCQRDPACRPRHVARMLPLEAALRAFARPPERWASHVYLRSRASPERRRELAGAFGLRDVQNLSPYLSGRGATTGLHWDGHAGILSQAKGEKLVQLFAPGRMPGQRGDQLSPCYRRSAQSGAACPPDAAHRLLLTPGLSLHIPRGWAHHVTSRSAYTLGCVWRFASPSAQE